MLYHTSFPTLFPFFLCFNIPLACLFPLVFILYLSFFPRPLTFSLPSFFVVVFSFLLRHSTKQAEENKQNFFKCIPSKQYQQSISAISIIPVPVYAMFSFLLLGLLI